eukprot:141182-Alexandrium_andersonii.AAC.1
MNGVAYHLCPKRVAINVMGHTQLDGSMNDLPMSLLREEVAEGGLVGKEGGLRANYIQLMPVAPWDKHYDVWGLGPESALIHEQEARQ